tara:strand:+ start:8 stop:535 length:528 start_codon:yes stop_codon:yes gene_type:complete
MNTLEKFEKEQLENLKAGKNLPEFNPGDTVKVHLKVKEGEKERIQVYEGVCIAKKNAGINSSFTVRKISYGEGIERVLPLYSPQINKIELVKSGDVRRSKLYYLRGRSGKSARISEKNTFGQVMTENKTVKQVSTNSNEIEKAEALESKESKDDLNLTENDKNSNQDKIDSKKKD